jgi:hypothetical protein
MKVFALFLSIHVDSYAALSARYRSRYCSAPQFRQCLFLVYPNATVKSPKKQSKKEERADEV